MGNLMEINIDRLVDDLKAVSDGREGQNVVQFVNTDYLIKMARKNLEHFKLQLEMMIITRESGWKLVRKAVIEGMDRFGIADLGLSENAIIAEAEKIFHLSMDELEDINNKLKNGGYRYRSVAERMVYTALDKEDV